MLFEFEWKRQVFAWAPQRIRGDFEEKTWQAFWRTFVEDMPVATIAAQLGMTCGAVAIARSRIIKRLRIEVQRQAYMELEP